MSYMALYRKWRPLVFRDVVGQEHIVSTLKNSVSAGRIAHAYLLSGTRGTGKTTTAKILARAVNCLSPKDGDPCNECEICKGILSGTLLDVIEIDAASNNSVDNVREIRDEVNYCPSNAKYKVYIIDEVHMLSTGAFNALLKTLEEPPEHVIFILATTEPNKLPATILSRCQRYDFRRISSGDIAKRLKMIADENGIKVDDDALKLIARLSDGALRDAISLLDQCFSLGKNNIFYEDVTNLAGAVDDENIFKIIKSIALSDISTLLGVINDMHAAGKDISRLLSDLIFHYRNLLIYCVSGNTEGMEEKEIERLKEQSEVYAHDRDKIIMIIQELSAIASEMKWSAYPKVLFEVTLIKLCELHEQAKNEKDKVKAAPAEIKHQQESSRKISPKAAENTAKKEYAESHEKKAEFEKWDEVLQKLKGSGRMVLYSNLLHAKAVMLSENQIAIKFRPDEGMKRIMVSKPENIELVESAISSLTGKEIRVKCLQDEKNEEGEKDDFIEKVKGFAEKIDIPINIVDD